MKEEAKAIAVSERLSKFLRLCGFEDVEKKSNKYYKGGQLESVQEQSAILMSKGNLKTAKMEKLIYYQLLETRNMRKITNSASKTFYITLYMAGADLAISIHGIAVAASEPFDLGDIATMNSTTSGSNLLVIE